MAKNYDHLDLPSNEKSFKRKIRGFGKYKKKENLEGFVEKQIKKLDNISRAYKQTQKDFPEYNQELFFKIKTSQKVNEDEFRKRLKGAGCETIVSTPGKHAEWIVSSSDPDMKGLKKRVADRLTKEKPNFVDGIAEFDRIKFEDKLGDVLKEKQFEKLEKAKIVLTITKKESDTDGSKLNAALTIIQKLAEENDLKFYDKLETENLCLVLMESTLAFAKQISQIDIVEKIDRPPQVALEKIINKNIPDFKKITPPNKDNHGVLVMDSGIILHPLIEDSVNKPFTDTIVGLPDRINEDDRSHGTRVSSIVLFNDIKQSITSRKFQSEVWLYSAKVFYESNNKVKPIESNLLEAGIKQSIEKIKSKFPKCKVVNMSFGYAQRVMHPGKRQLDLALLLDDLAIKYKDTIFVVSTGNINPNYYAIHQYPEYLMSKDLDVKIVDPSSSIHAISVGAVSKIRDTLDQPSNLTRMGPGLNEMIKPEFVEDGGGFNENVIVFNPNFKQRLFTFSAGTSFSAPKIANQLTRLYNQFPDYGRNLIIALLLSSAKIPDIRPDIFPKINSQISNKNLQKLLNVYGFGKPIFENALFSNDDYVVFKYEGKIKMNKARYFSIKLPDEFVNTKGNREISISLVFDPPVRKTRADYFGSRMEFHLFKNKPIDEIMKKYNELDLGDSTNDEEKVPKELQKYEIKLNPGSELRKKSPHQKGIRILSTGTKLNNTHPLVLTVLSQKKWLDENFEQDFAVVVTLKHETSIDLYNKIRLINQVRTRVRV